MVHQQLEHLVRLLHYGKDHLCRLFRTERILSGQSEVDSRRSQIIGFLGRRLAAVWETRFSLIEAGADRGRTAKEDKGSTCQALGLSTPPGGWRSALVSRSPASGGGCGALGVKARWLQSMSIELFCSCVLRIRSSGISRAVVSSAARRPTQRRDVSWPKRSGLLRRGFCQPVKPQGSGTGGDTGCTSLNCDSTGRPSCSLTIARSLGRGSHLLRNCAASQ